MNYPPQNQCPRCGVVAPYPQAVACAACGGALPGAVPSAQYGQQAPAPYGQMYGQPPAPAPQPQQQPGYGAPPQYTQLAPDQVAPVQAFGQNGPYGPMQPFNPNPVKAPKLTAYHWGIACAAIFAVLAVGGILIFVLVSQ